MTDEHIARAECEVAAPPERVWEALTTPALIREYMFGSEVETDWEVGSAITWKGEYEGRSYEDKGEVLRVEPSRCLEVTHFSPLSGQEDSPENYHRLRYDLDVIPDGTRLRLSQDNNSSAEEAEQFGKNWQMMLDGLKRVAERD